MNRNQAETLAAELTAEETAEYGECIVSFIVVEAHNHLDQWAVLSQDEDGTPMALWVSPEVSFPACV